MPRPLARLAVSLSLLVGGTLAVGATPVAADGDDRCFVAAAHRIFLDRDVAPDELETWTEAFAGGTPRHVLPAELAASDEWLTVVVTRIYQLALEREPEPDGLAHWIARLRAGERVDRIGALVFGSPEFYDRVDGDDETLVRAFYALILDRRAEVMTRQVAQARNLSQSEVDYWVGQIAPRGRDGVAREFYASVEARQKRVDDLYREILDRRAEPAGKQYWAERLATINDVRLAVFLASSAELYARTGRGCTLPGEVELALAAPAFQPSASHDGRFVAFTSGASDLTTDPDNGAFDVFLLDATTGGVTNLTPEGDGSSTAPSISADGTRVVFESRATNLTEDPDDAGLDVFLHDVATGTTTNLTSDSPLEAREAEISADGSHVVYQRTFGDFRYHAYLHEVATGATENLTPGSPAGVGAPTISGDGGLVAFAAFDVTPGPADNNSEIVVVDTDTGDAVDITPDNDAPADEPDLSADGSRVAFSTWATNLTGDADNGERDVFVHDLGSGTTVNITPRGNGSSGAPDLSADGSRVAFSSEATNLTGEPGNGAQDVFLAAVDGVRNLTGTTYLGEGFRFDEGNRAPSLSGDGAVVFFETEDPALSGGLGSSVARARIVG